MERSRWRRYIVELLNGGLNNHGFLVSIRVIALRSKEEEEEKVELEQQKDEQEEEGTDGGQ